MKKVILILVDGMRPDALDACGHTFVGDALAHGTHFLDAETVMPSVTLPCHMSLFHSVPATRHGILSNTYVPQVRPVKGLCEVLASAGKTCATFYNWEELKDITRPGSLEYSCFISGGKHGYENANDVLTKEATRHYLEYRPDFTFLYLGWTDAAGHDKGWMSAEYLRAVKGSWQNISEICRVADEDTLVIITADHGGHGRIHGTEMHEDMTIPIISYNPGLPSCSRSGGSIIDIAPTICDYLDVASDPDWEGVPLPIKFQ